MQVAIRYDDCPLCGNSFLGDPIDEDKLGFYSGTHYRREIGVEIRGVYDGVLFWQCPDCGARMHRWPVGHRLRKTAEQYMHVGSEEMSEW